MDSQLVTGDDWGSRGGYLLGGNGSILASTMVYWWLWKTCEGFLRSKMLSLG